jgi:hypothetical protein
MSNPANISLGAYNDFCRDLQEGTVLYNINPTSLWGDYLLVANKSIIRVGNVITYSVLLLGLKKENGVYKSRDLRISLTPDYAPHIPFLKYVGFCKFELLPVLKNVDIKTGLVAAYSNVDLHQFTKKLKIRKPQKHKYDRDGKPLIRKCNN